MTQSESELARKIAGALDQTSARLDPAVAERLAAARRTALARFRAEPAPAWAIGRVGSSTVAYGSYSQRPSTIRLLLLAAVLVCAAALGLTWHSQGQSDIAEIDAGLLSDELPINAYLDRGFDAWIKHVSR